MILEVLVAIQWSYLDVKLLPMDLVSGELLCDGRPSFRPCARRDDR